METVHAFRSIFRSCKRCQVASSGGKFYTHKQIGLKSSQSILCLQAKCFSLILQGLVISVTLVGGSAFGRPAWRFRAAVAVVVTCYQSGF